MYHVVGIGNALVDTEFLLDEAVLEKTGLAKGSMTLADEATAKALTASLAELGVHAKKQASGGSAANSVTAFASLGGKAYYHCRVANDALGKFYLEDLDAHGVTTNDAFAMTDGVTGSCQVLVTPEGERTMQTFLGTSAQICDENVDFETLIGADWLYLEGYLAMSPSIMPAITKLRQQAGVHGVKIAVSFADPAVVRFAKEGLLSMLGNGVSLIFCNLEEAQLFTEKKQHKACVKALTDHAEMVVVTNGAEPTLIAKKQGEEVTFFEVPSLATTVIDTNGAGDNYAGAFLYALTQSYSPEDSGRLAAVVAAAVVAQMGARLPKEDYAEIKKAVLG